MEKIICALWRGSDEAAAPFNARLLSEMPAALAALGATGIRLNVRDADIAPADPLIQTWQSPQQDAVLQFWLPSANTRFRQDIDAAIASRCDRFAAWLVSESTVIANTAHPPRPGERTFGWAQASFISFRGDMSRQAAMTHWQGHHTRIAIETQANFEYVQNAVVRPLTDNAPGYDAIVEECFGPEAMSDQAAFYGAVGDQPAFERNLAIMMDSCVQFIDFSRIDIVPTSQFDFHHLDRVDHLAIR